VLCCLSDVIPSINRFYVKIGHLLIVILKKQGNRFFKQIPFFLNFNAKILAFATLQQSNNDIAALLPIVCA
jgi:hypothetical protein